MDCALWLNKHKIYSADEIPDNLDIAALRGYFLGGSLEDWLREHNGEKYADKLAELDCGGGELNEALAEIFGGGRAAAASLIEMRGGLSENYPDCTAPSAGTGSHPSSLKGSFGSYGSFRLGSFRSLWEWEWFFRRAFIGSYRTGSFRFGSFSAWEWEWIFRRSFFGSYRAGSFRFGSFSEWEWEWLFRRGFLGSYRAGSFRLGSFSEWEWEWCFNRGSFGSYRTGSFRFSSLAAGSYKGFPIDGTFDGDGLEFLQKLDEYDRIMFLNLVNCPLNRFGYGIHNI